jgi:NAD+ synthase (glutamine-hydrolysing)
VLFTSTYGQKSQMMTKISIIQFNPIVGNIKLNKERIISFYKKALKNDMDMVVFPELSLCGYPPQDLLLRESFFTQINDAVADIRLFLQKCKLILGLPVKNNNKIYNCVFVMQKNKDDLVYCKKSLPNYGVFDEKRYFSAGKNNCVFAHNDTRFALNICEDVWNVQSFKELKNKADILININGSPYQHDKHKKRLKTLKMAAKYLQTPIIYLNQVGGQDELIFDGDSMIVDNNGKVILQMPLFCEKAQEILINEKIQPVKNIPVYPDYITRLYDALVLAIYDYATKNGFQKIVIALSGGIDSAVTLSLATAAVGAKNIKAIYMPSIYNADISKIDAKKQADTQNIKFIQIPITDTYNQILSAITVFFQDTNIDVTYENIQARIRGLFTMAIANKDNALVLTTGNKSEMATGYATLYGDMAGGFAPLKDVYKSDVYRLAHYINRKKEIIPTRVLTRPPTAELSPGQQDSDSLPNYDVLDKILYEFIENEKSSGEIYKLGFDKKIVENVLSLVIKSEHKRYQSPPGPKISKKAFDKERRYPITNQFIP